MALQQAGTYFLNSGRYSKALVPLHEATTLLEFPQDAG